MIKYLRAAAFGLAVPAAFAALALTGTASASVKPDATPACAFNCFSLSSLLTGHSQIQHVYIPHGNGVAVTGKAGDKLNLAQGNDSFPQEDLTTNNPPMTVADFCAPPGFPVSGQEFSATSYICLHYSGDAVYEANWAPYGNESGWCEGVAVPNEAGENVTLQPCGVTTSTLWIADASNAHLGATPWINGSDSQFSHPLVLTVDPGTHSPANQEFVQRLNLLTGGFVANSQEWRVHFGPFI